MQEERNTKHSLLSNTEIIMTNHHYTNNMVDTAAAAVNAGTCLEDGNTGGKFNIFTHIGEAVSQVSASSY